MPGIFESQAGFEVPQEGVGELVGAVPNASYPTLITLDGEKVVYPMTEWWNLENWIKAARQKFQPGHEEDFFHRD